MTGERDWGKGEARDGEKDGEAVESTCYIRLHMLPSMLTRLSRTRVRLRERVRKRKAADVMRKSGKGKVKSTQPWISSAQKGGACRSAECREKRPEGADQRSASRRLRRFHFSLTESDTKSEPDCKSPDKVLLWSFVLGFLCDLRERKDKRGGV